MKLLLVRHASQRFQRQASLKRLHAQEIQHMIEKNDVNAVQELIASGGFNAHMRDGAGMSALHHASSYGRAEIVKLLLAARCDANLQSGQSMSSPLHYAARWGHVETVQVLLDHGASPTFADVNGLTPMALSQKYGHILVTSLFAKAKKLNK